MQVESLGREDALEEGMETHCAVFLPGKCHGQRSLAGTLYGVANSGTQVKQLSKHARKQAPCTREEGTHVSRLRAHGRKTVQ